MKKYLGLFFVGSILLTSCSEKNDEPPVEKAAYYPPPTEEKIDNIAAPVLIENNEEYFINKSVFEYAKNIEVTDAREQNKHITLKIDLADDANPGQGTLNILSQTFDFLDQQIGFETFTIIIRVNDVKASQFKIHTEKFQPNEDDPMANLVLQASEIEFLTPEVKSFGETFELW